MIVSIDHESESPAVPLAGRANVCHKKIVTE